MTTIPCLTLPPHFARQPIPPTSSPNPNPNLPIPRSLQWKDGAFRSNAEVLIDGVPVIEVDGTVAICNGGGGALGHPIEYIQVSPHFIQEQGQTLECTPDQQTIRL